MFGNRLGNCAYDKVFLKDIKNVRPGAVVPANPPFRPANYPKPQTIVTNSTGNNVPSTNTIVPSVPKSSLANPPITVGPANTYDESVFDNSMMISEEDLISDENFGVMELEDSNVYPILPNKRR